jgi:hypothetical protein
VQVHYHVQTNDSKEPKEPYYDEDKDQLEEENTKKGEDHGLYNKPGLLISFTIVFLYFIYIGLSPF